MRILRYLLLVVSLSAWGNAMCSVDSLQNKLSKAKHDTTRIALTLAIGEQFQQNNPDTAMLVWQKAEELINKNLENLEQGSKLYKTFIKHQGNLLNKYAVVYVNKGETDLALENYRLAIEKFHQADVPKMEAYGVLNIGLLYYQLSNYVQALEHYVKSADLFKKIGSKKGEALAQLNIGNVFYSQGDNIKAIDQYHKSLKIREEIGDKLGQADCLNNLGNINYNINEIDKALEYYKKALVLFVETGNLTGVADGLGNIGIIYELKGDTAKALDHYLQGLEAQEEAGNALGIARAYHNIGDFYQYSAQNFDKALGYYELGADIFREAGNVAGVAATYISMGNILHQSGKLQQAQSYGEMALELSQEIGDVVNIRYAASLMANLSTEQGNHKDALEFYRLFIEMRDSLENQEVKRTAYQTEIQHEFEKKATADSIKRAEEKKVVAAQLKYERTQRLALYGGLVLLLVFAVFIYSRYKVSQKQKEIIEEQKHIVDVKQGEILDSIGYAKRLQDAILPPDDFVDKHLPNSFIYYKPKDIVAGDFYWMEAIGDKVLFAVADCTGHGVPGAMISIVCANALKRTVREFGIHQPDKMLEKVRELVIETFEKSEVRDGMDISLCVLDKASGELSWAGANNPLWYIDGDELKEIKGDKQPIGRFAAQQDFTNHTIKLNKGTSVYLFTDGYADQFGGPKGKKFKYSHLRQLVIDIANKPMSKQLNIIDQTFVEWMGVHEQVGRCMCNGVNCLT